MALIGKSTERTDDSEAQNTSRFAGTNLKGWARMENHVMRHDSATMKDYADDIDILLVFAALFSAILTTFVVQTYQLLQPGGNDTTNQLIAYQIFSQGTHPNMPPAINATISGLLTTSSFTPTSSARWINGLFFFSLIISLVAALFSIMARQWIREYLKWNAPLAPPRENVLVRQIRFESWEVWNVETFIWSIPVLQELAMVLFLIGVVVLVWTLDDTVAISVTILVAVFLTTILVLTVLPVFVKRCPYKSPTAWACIRFVDFVPYILQLSTSWVTYGGRHISYIALLLRERILQYFPRLARFRRFYIPKPSYDFNHTFSSAKTWRTDDMDFRRRFDRKDTKRQLAREATHLGPEGIFISEPDEASVSCENCFYKDLTQCPVLLRALEWVSMASPGDSQITTCIDECMTAVHPDRTSLGCTKRICRGVALTYLHPSQVSVQGELRRDGQPYVVLWPDWSNDAYTTRNPPQADPVTHYRVALGVIARLPSDKMQQVTFCLNTKFSLRSYYYTGDWQALHLRLLATDLATVTAGNMGSSSDWIRDDSSLRRVFEWLSMMTAYSNWNTSFRLQADHYLDGLRSILNNEPEHKTLLCSRAPGLRTLAFIVASRHAKVSITENKSLAISVGLTKVSEYETLLLEYFSHDSSQWSEDDLNIIIVIGWLWLAEVDVGSSSSEDKNIKIVKVIQDTLEVSLDRNTNSCRFLSKWNELYPFEKIVSSISAKPGMYWFSPSYISVFTGLLHVMETYFKNQLFNFDQEVLHKALEVAHSQDYSSCSLNACPWISHSCNDANECPLLEQEARPSPVTEDVSARPSQSDGGLVSTTYGEVAVPQSFLNRSKVFWRKRLQFTKLTNEESGGSSRNTRGDTSVGDIVAGPSRMISFSAMTSEERAKAVEAGGIPLVSFDSGRSPEGFSVGDQYVAAEAGLAGSDQYAPPSHSSAYIIDVEPAHVDEASARDDPTLITAHRLGSLERNIKRQGGRHSIGSSSPSAFPATCPLQSDSDVPSGSPCGKDTVAPLLTATGTVRAQPEDNRNISLVSATSVIRTVEFVRGAQGASAMSRTSSDNLNMSMATEGLDRSSDIGRAEEPLSSESLHLSPVSTANADVVPNHSTLGSGVVTRDEGYDEVPPSQSRTSFTDLDEESTSDNNL